MHRASCPSQLPSLVCKILVLLFSLSETNTIGYYGYAPARKEAETQLEWSQEYYRRWHARRHAHAV